MKHFLKCIDLRQLRVPQTNNFALGTVSKNIMRQSNDLTILSSVIPVWESLNGLISSLIAVTLDQKKE